jgi:hypothetical protein
MAKFYGSLVGAVLQLTPPRQVDMAYANTKDQILVRDTIEVNAIAANDVVQLAVVGWETVIDPSGSDFWFDDLGTGGTVSVGDITYPNALANAVNTDSAAGSSKVCVSVDIANYFKPLWAMLGYATLAAAQAVGAQCELLLKRNTAAVTGICTISWQIRGNRRI